jgi:aminoglycoside 6'-N-acetyltransferase
MATDTTSAFSEAELAYLRGERRLARIATVGRDGTPHVVPVGMWTHNAEHDTIDVTGRQFERTKKFLDVARTGRAAIVVDDLASVDPWRPRAVEVRGRAEAIHDRHPLIRIHPERVVSWGHRTDSAPRHGGAGIRREGRAMIARIWTGAVRKQDGAAYADYMRRTGVPGYVTVPGNRGVWMLRRDAGDRTEFVMLTLWDSLDAVKAFAGEDLETAVFYPEDERFLIERDVRAKHYELAHETRSGGSVSELPTLRGRTVVLRPLRLDDVERLAEIQAEQGVARWWGPPDLVELRSKAEGRSEETALAIEADGEVVGLIKFHEEDEPDFRHAGIDLFLTERAQGRGLGSDAVRTLARYLIDEHGHHRLTIDPAADNRPAIRAYEKVGFRPVGRMREYWRSPDGSWHDGLLMDLLARELDPRDSLEQKGGTGDEG